MHWQPMMILWREGWANQGSTSSWRENQRAWSPCDAQLLAVHDLMGFTPRPMLWFVKMCGNITPVIMEAPQGHFGGVHAGFLVYDLCLRGGRRDAYSVFIGWMKNVRGARTLAAKLTRHIYRVKAEREEAHLEVRIRD